MERGRLVLSRKVGKEVYIGDAVVRVHSIKGGTVRLCIEAPKDVPIIRPDAKRKEAA
jgi:carbon storage regulator CsrA